MTSITDVLHHLVRRGLALRIDTHGTLFIYDPRRYTRGAEAVVGQHQPAKTQALSARAERRLLEEARHALTSAIAISTGAAAANAPVAHTVRSVGAGAGMGGTASTSTTKPAVDPATATADTSTHAANRNATATAGPLPDHGRFVPTGAQWRGITWLDVPGRDVNIKKLNFTLLKRGKLKGYKDCAGLHGASLRQRLNEISGRNRDNSLKRLAEARLRDQSNPRPKPP